MKMICSIEINTEFYEKQNGVSTRTADVKIYIRDKRTNVLIRYAPMRTEIIRETETETTYEVDFRQIYPGSNEARFFYPLGIQRFRKYSDSRELEVEI